MNEQVLMEIIAPNGHRLAIPKDRLDGTVTSNFMRKEAKAIKQWMRLQRGIYNPKSDVKTS